MPNPVNPDRLSSRPGSLRAGSIAGRPRGGGKWSLKTLGIVGGSLGAAIVVIALILRRLDDKARDIEKSQNRPWAMEANNRGVREANRGDLEAAIAEYNEAIKLCPDLAVAWCNRGAARIHAGEVDRGIADCDKAIALDPKLAMARGHRAGGRYSKRDYDGAFADAEEAIRLDPECAVAFMYRAYVLMHRKDMAGAREEFTKCLKLEPLAHALYGRGLVNEATGDLDAAEKDFKADIDMNSQAAPAWLGLGRIQLGRQEFEDAVKSCNEALKIHPKYAEAFTIRAAAYAALGNAQAAEADEIQAKALAPPSAK